MRIYNPIVGGKYIEEIKLGTDKFLEVSDETGQKLLKMYLFLVDYNDPKYGPDYYDSNKPTTWFKIKRFLKIK